MCQEVNAINKQTNKQTNKQGGREGRRAGRQATEKHVEKDTGANLKEVPMPKADAMGATE